jgi:hypothetical protein
LIHIYEYFSHFYQHPISLSLCSIEVSYILLQLVSANILSSENAFEHVPRYMLPWLGFLQVHCHDWLVIQKMKREIITMTSALPSASAVEVSWTDELSCHHTYFIGGDPSILCLYHCILFWVFWPFSFWRLYKMKIINQTYFDHFHFDVYIKWKFEITWDDCWACC